MKCKKEKVMKHISFLLNDASKPGVVFDLEGTLLYVNNAFHEEFGVEGTGNIKQFIVEPSTDIWDEIISCVHESEQKIVDMNIRIDQDRIHVVKVHLMYFDDVQQIIALFDVLHYDDNLAERTYIHAFRNSDSFMAIVSSRGIIQDVNAMHTEFFNVPKDYFVGKGVSAITELFQQDEDLQAAYMKDIEIYGYAEETIRYEHQVDNARYYHVSTFFDNETNTYLIRMVDRTEKMVLEERLVRSGSLSTVGELAASIAHEIRNPMTTLKGFVQLLKLSASDDALKYLAVIDDEIERMELILSEMLILAKPGLNKKTVFSLEVLVADMVQVMYPKALLENITIEQKITNLQSTLIDADVNRIKQVLLNIFKNAFEAMSPGGTLTTSIELGEAEQLVLRISDTGKGMSTNQINSIFMPFFTCKPEGTGLGLPFVLKTIEDHGGTVTVESEIDKGTTFIVTFPLVLSQIPGLVLGEEKLLSS